MKIGTRWIAGILSAVMLWPLTLPAMASGARTGPYIYSVLQSGQTVSVRLDAPDGGNLIMAVYKRANGQFVDVESVTVPEGVGVRTLNYVLRKTPASTEYVRAFLLDNSGKPLTRSVMSDYVIPSSDQTPSVTLSPTPTPKPTPTPIPTNTPTPLPTNTPTPTRQPTGTPTPRPTSTPGPTATPTQSPP